MPTIQLPFEAILEATDSLSLRERNQLVRHIEGVEAQQERAWARRIDSILLRHISESVPLPGDLERLHELRELTNEGTLSPQEHAEYLRIIARVEALGVQRLKLVIELAHLREVPPAQLADEMQLFPGR